ncbi:prominin-1-A isoform X3 [Phlebotomus papatasi]|uniref:prominin-1-A isoform X3 n=1 Tax=Phlebotomus papatasi TaxID=29031 RepID=UPI002483B5ED|nr:prominin-1-A isoform X3 [Phlebotomus papatasi]
MRRLPETLSIEVQKGGEGKSRVKMQNGSGWSLVESPSTAFFDDFEDNDDPEAKPTGSYAISTLEVHEGAFHFTYLATFLSYITPHELPVELLRDVFRSRVSVPQLILEALKIESGFICLVGLFFLVGIIPLSILIAWSCAGKSTISQCDSQSGSEDTTTASSMVGTTPPPRSNLMAIDESLEDALNCRKRVLAGVLQFILIALLASIATMFVTNEQVASTLEKTPSLVRISLQDAETFIKDSFRQITFHTHSALSNVSESIEYDLIHVDTLLGEPIRRDLAQASGIEEAFEALLNLCALNIEVLRRVHLLQKSVSRAIVVSADASARIEDLQFQLSVLQRQCLSRDRPLCDTLRLRGFEESGFMRALHDLQRDPALLRMMSLGEVEVDSRWQNLSHEVASARANFFGYPLKMMEETEVPREKARKELIRLRDAFQWFRRDFGILARNLVDEVDHLWGRIVPAFDEMQIGGRLLWIFGICCSIVALLVTLLIYSSLSCSCCEAEEKAGITLLGGTTLMSICSLSLSFFCVMVMLLGGHGEVFLCRPLADSPNYTVLQRLLDKPGLLLTTQSQIGVINSILNRASHAKNATVTTSLGDVIENCGQNASTYATFQLETILEASQIANLDNYPTFTEAVERVVASEEDFLTLTASLGQILNIIISESHVNLTKYRMHLSQAIPERDLATFIDQMQRVSLQIRDVATSSRMTTLGSRARRLEVSVMQFLEQLRAELLYHLTALELQKDPWDKQLNISLKLLRSAQEIINEEAREICRNHTESYQIRLKNHFSTAKDILMDILNGNSASCWPLFAIFMANRALFCAHLMDPLNGLWFSTFCCLLLWAICTPICLSLAQIFRRLRKVRKFRHTNSHQYGAPSDIQIISEQSNWGATTRQDDLDIDRSNW